MKKRSTLKITLAIVVCTVLITGCSNSSKAQSSAVAVPVAEVSSAVAETPAGTDKVFDLKLSHSMAITSYSQKAYEYFAQACNEESGGTINITVYPGSTLVSDVEAFDAVLNGNVDIAQFQVSYMSGFVKEFMVLEIPGVYSGSQFPALHQATKDIMNEIMAKYGVKYVSPIPHDVLVFVGDSIVKDPAAELSGKKIRVAGKWGGEAVTKWGGSPMTINIGDVPTALERKTINLVNTSWIATGGFKLYEMGPNVTFTDMQEIFPGLILNQSVWDSFSEEQKAAFERATDRFVEHGYMLMQAEKESFLRTLEENNVQIYTSTADENAFYHKIAMELVEQVRPEVGPLGEKLIKAFSIPELQ